MYFCSYQPISLRPEGVRAAIPSPFRATPPCYCSLAGTTLSSAPLCHHYSWITVFFCIGRLQLPRKGQGLSSGRLVSAQQYRVSGPPVRLRPWSECSVHAGSTSCTDRWRKKTHLVPIIGNIVLLAKTHFV